eukprot:429566-Pelagomonas_calceolata.AAC.1
MWVLQNGHKLPAHPLAPSAMSTNALLARMCAHARTHTHTCTYVRTHIHTPPTSLTLLMQVRNIPPTATTEDVKVAIEAHGLTVKSVVFNPDEKQKDADTQVALVRFPPLPLPWKLTEEDLAAPLLPELQHPEPAAEKKEGEGAPEVKKEGEDVKKEGEEAKQEEVKKEGEEVKKEGTADVKMDGAAEEKKEGEGAAAQEKKEDKGAAGEAPKTAPAVEEEKKKEVLPAASPAKPIVVQPAKPLPDGRKEGDVFTFAHFVATRLMQRRLAVGEK